MANIGGLLKKYNEISDERFFQDVVINGEYKLALNEKADVIIDVGSLAGEFSVYMYDKAKVIYALEPYSKHFKELTDNVKEFNLDKIKPFNLALADYNGTGLLKTSGARGGQHLVSKDSAEEKEPVQVKTLATFMKEQDIEQVDILKIDIESGESLVFGADDFKEVADKIRFIIGEHAEVEVERLLKQHGFIVTRTERGFIGRHEK